MDSAIDRCLDELRRAFEDIDHWIHVPVFEFLVSIPEGNENDLYDLAGKYSAAAQLHAGHAHDVASHLNDLYTGWSGDGAAQAAGESLQQYMRQLAGTTEALNDMEKLVNGGAQDIESTKYMAILNLVFLLITLIQVIMTLIVSFGATAAEGAGAIALCKQLLADGLKALLTKLRNVTVKALLKLALKRGLQFAAFTALSKGGIYIIQSAEGHDPTWDWKSFTGEMVDSFATGFIGGPLSFGLHGPIGEGLAMGGGQLGDNAFRWVRGEAFGNDQWAQDLGLAVDPNDVHMMDGVAQGMLFGSVMAGGESLKELPGRIGSARAGLDLGRLGTMLDDAPLSTPDLLPGNELAPGLGLDDVSLNDTSLDDGALGDGSLSGDAANAPPGATGNVGARDDAGAAGNAGASGDAGNAAVSNDGGTAGAGGDDGAKANSGTDGNAGHDGNGSTVSDSKTGTTAADRNGTSSDTSTDTADHGGNTATDAADRNGNTASDTSTRDPAGHDGNTASDTSTRDPAGHDGGSSTDQRHSEHDQANHGDAGQDQTGREHTDQSSTTHDGRDGNGHTGDRTGGSNGDRPPGSPGREQPRWHEWKQRYDHRIAEGYGHRIAAEFLGKDGKQPLTLSHDMVDRVLGHRPDDMSPFGHRLRGFVEDHLTTTGDDGLPIAMDDAAIRATLSDLGGFTDRPAIPRARTAADDIGADIDESEHAREATEPAADDVAARSSDASNEEWADAAAKPITSTKMEYGQQLFGSVLDHEFAGAEWDPRSSATITAATRMVDRMLATARPALARAREAAPLRDFFTGHLTTVDADGVRVPLDADAMGAKLDELYGGGRDPIVPAMDDAGRGPVDRGTDTSRVDDEAPSGTGPASHPDAGSEHTTNNADGSDAARHDTVGRETAGPETSTGDSARSDGATTAGPDSDGADRAAGPRPKGPVKVDPEPWRVERTYLDHPATATESAKIGHETVDRFRHILEFDKYPLDDPTDIHTPEAHAATVDAARMLADELHERHVAAMHDWLTSTEVTPDQTEMVRIGQTATAVMLRDGTLVAATSVREVRVETHVTSLRRGEPLPPDLDEKTAATSEFTHWAVADVYDAIPARMRSMFQGHCGESSVLSHVAERLEEPFERDFLQRAGVSSVEDLTPDQRDALRTEFSAHLHDQLEGGNIVSVYSGGAERGAQQFPCESDDLLIDHFGLRSEYIDRISSETYVDADHGVISFVPEGGALRDHAATIASAHKDWLVVVVHGEHSAKQFAATFGDERLGHVEIARLISRIRDDNVALHSRTKVVLISCDSARTFDAHRIGETTFAKQLANRLSTEVVAPQKRAWISNHGRVRVDPPDHEPGTSETTGEGWTHTDQSGVETPGTIDHLVGRNDAIPSDTRSESWEKAHREDDPPPTGPDDAPPPPADRSDDPPEPPTDHPLDDAPEPPPADRPDGPATTPMDDRLDNPAESSADSVLADPRPSDVPRTDDVGAQPVDGRSTDGVHSDVEDHRVDPRALRHDDDPPTDTARVADGRRPDDNPPENEQTTRPATIDAARDQQPARDTAPSLHDQADAPRQDEQGRSETSDERSEQAGARPTDARPQDATPAPAPDAGQPREARPTHVATQPDDGVRAEDGEPQPTDARNQAPSGEALSGEALTDVAADRPDVDAAERGDATEPTNTSERDATDRDERGDVAPDHEADGPPDYSNFELENWHSKFPETLLPDDPLLTSTHLIDTPERREWRDEVVRNALHGAEPVTEGKPVMYLMGGGGASGKGTLLTRLIHDGIVPERNVVHLDPDEIKAETIPEYAEIVRRGDSRAAAVAHEESSDLGKRILKEAQERKLNIIYDVTLGDPRKAIAMIARAKEAGYEIRLYGVSADAGRAVDWNLSRAKKSGRWVPIKMQLTAHRGFSRGFAAYADLVDSAELYDTSGGRPSIMAVKFPGRPLEIVDEGRYDSFLHKAEIDRGAAGQGDLYDVPQRIEPPATAPDRAQYVDGAMANLAHTSRTAAGTIDTTASAGKADQMAADLSGDRAAHLAQDNYRSVVAALYDARNIQFADPAELRGFVEHVVTRVNAGILRDGVLYREHDSEKYPSYTRVADLPRARERFFDELYRRLADPAADPVETAAWVEYRMDMTDHLWADGCGKSAKAVAAWVLMRSGYDLPAYPAERAAQFAHAPTLPSATGPGVDAVQFRDWLDYYSSLFRDGA